MRTKRILIPALIVAFIALGLGCSDDDDNGPTGPGDTTPAWVGEWLSAGADVAPLLVAFFNIDSVRVTFNENQTVTLSQHDTVTENWVENTGTYLVTEEATGTIHSIAISYTGGPIFDQEGIIEVTAGTPDMLQLEVVQTVPDIGATPHTPADGFGNDPTWGDQNVQTYRRVN